MDSESAWEIVLKLKLHGHLNTPEKMNLIQNYLLLCCRRIWILLPGKGSREGVELEENYLKGKISRDDAKWSDYNSEASAFMFDYAKDDDEEVNEYIRAAEANFSEITKLLVPTVGREEISAKQLLNDAAYFANFAICFPGIRFGTQPEKSMIRDGKFMPLYLLKQVVPNSLINAVYE